MTRKIVVKPNYGKVSSDFIGPIVSLAPDLRIAAIMKFRFFLVMFLWRRAIEIH